jgi:hypothetical protein
LNVPFGRKLDPDQVQDQICVIKVSEVGRMWQEAGISDPKPSRKDIPVNIMHFIRWLSTTGTELANLPFASGSGEYGRKAVWLAVSPLVGTERCK